MFSSNSKSASSQICKYIFKYNLVYQNSLQQLLYLHEILKNQNWAITRFLECSGEDVLGLAGF